MPKDRKRLATIALSALLLENCSDNASHSKISIADSKPAQICLNDSGFGAAIINGQTPTVISPIARSTVFVATHDFVDGQSRETRCSGVLIGRRLVLTAAHCVRADLDEPERSEQTAVYFGPENQTAPATVIKIKSHPDFSADDHVNDLALAFLAEAAPSMAQTMPISFEPQTFSGGDPIYVAGYGRETDLNEGDSDDRAGRLHFAVLFPSQDPGHLPPRSAPHPDRDLLILDADRGSAVCSGDSGGPALIANSCQFSLIGIAAFVYDGYNARLTCRSRNAFTLLAPFKDWILKSAGRYL